MEYQGREIRGIGHPVGFPGEQRFRLFPQLTVLFGPVAAEFGDFERHTADGKATAGQ
ncbi:hypothetical protein AB0H71_10110 [Nocardia sp. NPDC050697]|uniref:hypothetical protein n=1 Tax=Nocardia sp. NPDC050697 TaxID=3155158 RepID=UPI0033F2D291